MRINFEKRTNVPEDEAQKILEQVDYKNNFFQKYWSNKTEDVQDDLADKFFLDELENAFVSKGYKLTRNKECSMLEISSPQKSNLKVYSCFSGWREGGGLIGIFSRTYNRPPTTAYTTGHINFDKKGEDPKKIKSILENLDYRIEITTDKQEKRAKKNARLTKIIENAIERSKPIEIAEMWDY